jgi:hypothetical protein
VTFESTRPAKVEWETLEDGRNLGWASCVVEEDIVDFDIRLDGIAEPTSIYDGTWKRKVHECPHGGESNDRAALPWPSPSRASSIAVDPDDSN